ncbi:hypothetical protein MNBD_NITROSPINAE02-1481 [hydrothermal vent metagenome]|uniref:non-specific protein-tyrosine kinase n=1 Tax=hydrothermal vent metagenome TaxID=652676 RepID=A0A3B1C250_9ZZZZ
MPGYNKDENSGGYVEPYQNSSDADGDEINLSEYWYTIKRNKWGILGLAFVATLIGVLTAFSMKPIYRASVTILIEPEQPKFVSVIPMESGSNINYFYATQYKIIRSRSVAESVIDKLNLAEKEGFADLVSKKKTGFIEEYLPASWFPEKREATEEEKKRRLIAYFSSNLRVVGYKNSQIAIINYEAYNPQLAADIANAVAAAYIETGMESRLMMAKQATSWLTEKLSLLRTKLEESEKTLQRYQAREGVVDTKSQKSIINRKLVSITEELIKAQTRRAEAEIRYMEIKNVKNERGYESIRAVLRHPLIQKLKEEESRMARRVSELSKRYGKKHPKMIAAISDYKEARRTVRKEVKRVVDGIRRDFEAAVANEKELRRLSNTTEKDARRIKGKEFEMAKLEREVSANRQLHDLFLTRFKETNMGENANVTNVRIIDRAEPPMRPHKPKKSRIVGLALFIGIFLGVILAFVQEHLDKTFRNTDDVERFLTLPVLGSVPTVKKGGDDAFGPEWHSLANPRSPFAESVNHIRTSVMFSNIDNPPKIIMITSAMPSEGKSTLATNMALAYSNLGKTLLIDADLRKHSLTEFLDSNSNGLGLTDLVSGQNTFQDCIRRLKLSKNLYILTSGATPPNPLEFLSSRRLANTFNQVKKAFDTIIIDTPPILLFSDAMVVGQLVDCCILSIRSDQTTHNMAQDAVKRLTSSQLKPLGVVLSYANTKGGKSYGGYYGDYYGDYYGAEFDEDEDDFITKKSNKSRRGKRKGRSLATVGGIALALTIIAYFLWNPDKSLLSALPTLDIGIGSTAEEPKGEALSKPWSPQTGAKGDPSVKPEPAQKNSRTMKPNKPKAKPTAKKQPIAKFSTPRSGSAKPKPIPAILTLPAADGKSLQGKRVEIVASSTTGDTRVTGGGFGSSTAAGDMSKWIGEGWEKMNTEGIEAACPVWEAGLRSSTAESVVLIVGRYSGLTKAKVPLELLGEELPIFAVCAKYRGKNAYYVLAAPSPANLKKTQKIIRSRLNIKSVKGNYPQKLVRIIDRGR